MPQKFSGLFNDFASRVIEIVDVLEVIILSGSDKPHSSSDNTEDFIDSISTTASTIISLPDRSASFNVGLIFCWISTALFSVIFPRLIPRSNRLVASLIPRSSAC